MDMPHEGSDGSAWVGTFIFSLALWGFILGLTVFLGHILANMMAGH